MTTDSKALVPRSPAVSESQALGKILAASGFFNDAKQEAQAITKVLAGQELGIAPIASMTGIYIIQGKLVLGAQLMGACIKRSSRYDWKVKEFTDKKCSIEFYERTGTGVGSLGISTFTMEDAKAAGLLGKAGGNWEKFPRNMLWARAMSNGAKWYCPDVFGGAVYVPEELQADGISVIDVTASPDAVPAPTPAQAPTTKPEAPAGVVAPSEPVPASVQELVRRAGERGIMYAWVCQIARDVEKRPEIRGPGEIKDIPGVWAAVLAASKEAKP